MVPEASLVSCHIHVDGPVPGPHSLLTVTSVAHTGDGAPLGTFSRNVRELPGARPHPDALRHWRRRPADWLSTRRRSHPPAMAMAAFTGWISRLPGEPTFVAHPSQPDYLFLYWYLHRFAGGWPFARFTAEIDDKSATGACPLASCRDADVGDLSRTS